MQTFLPYADFKLSAQTLDKKRCWKQVVEAHQILNALRLSREGTPAPGKKKIGYANHSATRMWRGYEGALSIYYNAFFDVAVEKWKVKVEKMKRIELPENKFLFPMPKWFGFPLLHSTHRGRLLDKNFDFYSQYKWPEKPIPKEECFWPVDLEGRLHPVVEEWLEKKTRNWLDTLGNVV